jgi:hypothetical protein
MDIKSAKMYGLGLGYISSKCDLLLGFYEQGISILVF